MFLCLINTHVFAISRFHLALFEVVMLLSTSVLFLLKVNLRMLALILFVLANCFLLAIFKGGFDPKLVRNFLIPILIIWLGSNVTDKKYYDKFVFIIALSIILFGIFEGLFSTLYQKLLNVLQYQIAIGAAAEEKTVYLDTNLALNGMRISGRNFFEFIFGRHRISSVFLESASMSNFGVVVAAWGLSKSAFKKVLPFLAMGITVTVLSDSRFGVSIISLLIILRFLWPSGMLKGTSFMMPVFVIITCIFVYFNYYDGLSDDFKGRLGLNGEFLLHFKLSEFFGMYNIHYNKFADSGYALLFHHYGIVFALIIWSCLYFLPTDSIVGERFKSFVAVIISANLAISGDAIYALKMSALMWFLMGTLCRKQVVGSSI